MKQFIKNNVIGVLILCLTFFLEYIRFTLYKLKEEEKHREAIIIGNLYAFDRLTEKMLNLQKSIVSETDPTKLEELLLMWEYAEDTFIISMGLTGGNFLTDELFDEYYRIHNKLMECVYIFKTATTQEERKEIMSNTDKVVKELVQFRVHLIEELDVKLKEEF